jgi:hypothetical protein
VPPKCSHRPRSLVAAPDHPSALSRRRGPSAVGDLALAHEAAIDEHGQVVVGTDDRFPLGEHQERVIALATKHSPASSRRGPLPPRESPQASRSRPGDESGSDTDACAGHAARPRRSQRGACSWKVVAGPGSTPVAAESNQLPHVAPRRFGLAIARRTRFIDYRTFDGARIAAGSVDHRGHPVPAVTPERDGRRAVATDPRLVASVSEWSNSAPFCSAVKASASPARADVIEFVPERQRCRLAADFRFDRILQGGC